MAEAHSGKIIRRLENGVFPWLGLLGYDGKHIGGPAFLSMGSTLMDEQGWNRDAIARRLSHGEFNELRAA